MKKSRTLRKVITFALLRSGYIVDIMPIAKREDEGGIKPDIYQFILNMLVNRIRFTEVSLASDFIRYRDGIVEESGVPR
jgi:hypothetical protein